MKRKRKKKYRRGCWKASLPDARKEGAPNRGPLPERPNTAWETILSNQRGPLSQGQSWKREGKSFSYPPGKKEMTTARERRDLSCRKNRGREKKKEKDGVVMERGPRKEKKGPRLDQPVSGRVLSSTLGSGEKKKGWEGRRQGPRR